MDFGTVVLVNGHSIYRDFLKAEYGRSYVSLLRVGTYIFHRPDTGEVIVEMDKILIQVNSEDVYPFNKANLKLFKEKLQSHYMIHVEGFAEKEMNLSLEKDSIQVRVDETKSMIAKLEERNNVEYTEGRVKQIQGISKNMRKMEKRIASIEKSIGELHAKTSTYRKELNIALQLADQNFTAS